MNELIQKKLTKNDLKENIIKEEVGLDVLSDNGITDMGSHIWLGGK